MKRSLLILLALCTLFTFTACSSNSFDETPTVNGDTDDKPSDDFEFTAPNDNPKSDVSVSAWTAHSYTKIAANGTVPTSASTSYKVYMAKRETEGCQVVFRPETDCSLTLKCIYKEENSLDYKTFVFDTNYEINGSLLPDPAKQYTEGTSFSCKAGNTLPFLIEFTSVSGTKEGHYPYVFELRDKSDKTVAQFVIIVRVWDITLPEKLSYQSSVTVSKKDIANYFSVSEEEITDEVYLNYYNLLLEHNLSARDLPYDILDPRADEYMSDPRVTAFRVPHDVSDETLEAYYKKLKTNTKWLKKAFFMPAGELSTKEEIDEFCLEAIHLQSICKSIKITCPMDKDIQIDPRGWDQVNAMKGYCTLWCPKLCLWDDEISYGKHDYEHSMSFEARMRKMMSEDFGVWTYLSYTPGEPYTALVVDHSGLNQRVVFWQQYMRGIHGFVYWSSTAWSVFNKVDPWQSVDTGLYDDKGNHVYGDGILFYPGKSVTDAPTVSLRMKIMRDGIDDMELLMYAAKTLGNKWVNEKVNSISSSLTSIEATDDIFAQIRIEIGSALEKALP
ncbi:MAG: DUF4091 domain-containing protein [Ruminococcaceae bacterium]|nr:DUF4091 domain-containing protein [Oscillospiraceae bacterium]